MEVCEASTGFHESRQSSRMFSDVAALTAQGPDEQETKSAKGVPELCGREHEFSVEFSSYF